MKSSQFKNLSNSEISINRFVENNNKYKLAKLCRYYAIIKGIGQEVNLLNIIATMGIMI